MTAIPYLDHFRQPMAPGDSVHTTYGPGVLKAGVIYKIPTPHPRVAVDLDSGGTIWVAPENIQVFIPVDTVQGSFSKLMGIFTRRSPRC